jgi:CRP/FNR family cyclic AMP-dependent transcriptional regulator
MNPRRLLVPDLARLFKGHPFIATMGDNHITTLEDCGVSLALFAPDERIVREGEDADACFFIEDGDVALEIYIGGAESRTVQTVHGGEIVGWSWLIPPYRGAFDATALTPVTALRVDASRLREAMDDDGSFGYEMLKRFCEVIVTRIGSLRLQLIDMYGLDAGEIGMQRLRASGAHRFGE